MAGNGRSLVISRDFQCRDRDSRPKKKKFVVQYHRLGLRELYSLELKGPKFKKCGVSQSTWTFKNFVLINQIE